MEIHLTEPIDLDTITPDDVLTDVDGFEWFRDAGGTWQIIRHVED